MTPIVVPPLAPSSGVSLESHLLDTLEVADGVLFDLDAPPVFTPAPLRLDWVGGADTDGSVPLDAGRSDNSTLMLPIRVTPQPTADLTWANLGLLVAKLEQARATPAGLVHTWTPKDKTDSWLLTVRSGAIPDMPMDMAYLQSYPHITVVLTCDPFLYKAGETVLYTEVTSTEPVFSIALANVPGHVDAEATVTLTDNASQARRHAEWGLGNQAVAFLVDSASLTLLAGATMTRGGGYSASGVVRATLATSTQGVCGTGNLTHVGVHRPKARIWATNTAIRIRLAYRTADGPYSYTPWVTPHVINDWCEIAFGVITISPVTAGTQQWDGRIEAYSTLVGATLDVDTFMMLPAERWGKARATYTYLPGVIIARDEFTSVTAGSALNARVAPSGGSWTTVGATTDWVAADAPAGLETMSRATTADASPRLAALGTTNYTNVEVGGANRTNVSAATSPDLISGLIARWTNSTNYFVLQDRGSDSDSGSADRALDAVIVVAGAETSLGYAEFASEGESWRWLRVVIFASGRGVAQVNGLAGSVLATINFSSAVLATGGTLATGEPGLYDMNSSGIAVTRYYDDFYAATPPAEPIVIHSGRAIEIRHDATERQSSDAVTYGRPQSYTGGRAYIPPAGALNRTTTLWGKAKRNDIDTAADANIADSLKLKVALRPRYRTPT